MKCRGQDLLVNTVCGRDYELSIDERTPALMLGDLDVHLQTATNGDDD